MKSVQIPASHVLVLTEMQSTLGPVHMISIFAGGVMHSEKGESDWGGMSVLSGSTLSGQTSVENPLMKRNFL